MISRINRPVVTYGIEQAADVRATDIVREGLRTRFTVHRAGKASLAVTLNRPGRHNVLNALAAIAVATELEVSDGAIQAALQSFQGIDRRLQQNGDVQTANGTVTLIDDYGHHPTELAATLEAIRQGWPGRRILLAFQPHRYTRTRDLLDDFASVLAGVDALIVTEVYAAGEAPITGADGKAICRAIRSHARVEPIFLEKIELLPQALVQIARDGDLIVTMGAGSIGAIAAELPKTLASVRPAPAVERRRSP
jgi:UDP-N-acetylmuramate--alanine ligase